jgi:NAD+ diphosphatase
MDPDATFTFFSGLYIDRRSELRDQADWLEAARGDPDTLYVVARGSTQLVHADDEARVAFIRGEHALLRATSEQRLILLGWYRGARCVLVDLSGDEVFEPPPGASFEELRPLAGRLSADDAGLLAYARALSYWRAQHRFCGRCGARTLAERAGHVLRCCDPDCNQQSFPRIDPAIIVLVHDGERALLGRQHDWPAGRYSTIAGFVEPGESLEDTVAREVFEETGVRLEQIDYSASQPWPFPSSLMIGFQARARAGSPIRVGAELEDARWFTREDIAASRVLLPPSHSISYRLVQRWFDSGSDTPLATRRGAG